MPINPKVPAISLNNGVTMPQFGLGVYQVKDGPQVEATALAALEAGYRLIDTAALYGNERSVGAAIRASGIPRQELFVTTKLWNDDQGYDSTFRAFDRSLQRLGMDYVDLYLIHWPCPARGKFLETWSAFERLYEQKASRAIGISNFLPEHIQTLLDVSKTTPAINQVELHPHLQQAKLRAYCQTHGIQVESHSPLKHGADVLTDPAIQTIASKHGKTAGQIILRWHIEEQLVVIPKSINPERIRQNIDIFDFALDAEDLQTIRGLDRNERVAPNPATFG